MNFSFWPFLWFGLPGRLLNITFGGKVPDPLSWHYVVGGPPSKTSYRQACMLEKITNGLCKIQTQRCAAWRLSRHRGVLHGDSISMQRQIRYVHKAVGFF